MKVKASEFLLSKKEELKRLVAELRKDFTYVSVLGTDVTGSSYSVKKVVLLLNLHLTQKEVL